MTTARVRIALWAVPLVLLSFGCREDGASRIASVPSVQRDLLSDDGGDGDSGLPGDELLYCPNDESYKTTQVVGPEGGVIVVGPHQLAIPRDALKEPVRITAQVKVGDNVAVEFEPEGLNFERPTALTLSYKGCSVLDGLLLRVVYVDDGDIQDVLPSVTDLLSQTVTGKLEHFSGYMLAD